MARPDAWGGAWGVSWGYSWGLLAVVPSVKKRRMHISADGRIFYEDRKYTLPDGRVVDGATAARYFSVQVPEAKAGDSASEPQPTASEPDVIEFAPRSAFTPSDDPLPVPSPKAGLTNAENRRRIIERRLERRDQRERDRRQAIIRQDDEDFLMLMLFAA